jgi:hypothetical protein
MKSRLVLSSMHFYGLSAVLFLSTFIHCDSYEWHIGLVTGLMYTAQEPRPSLRREPLTANLSNLSSKYFGPFLEIHNQLVPHLTPELASLVGEAFSPENDFFANTKTLMVSLLMCCIFPVIVIVVLALVLRAKHTSFFVKNYCSIVLVLNLILLFLIGISIYSEVIDVLKLRDFGRGFTKLKNTVRERLNPLLKNSPFQVGPLTITNNHIFKAMDLALDLFGTYFSTRAVLHVSAVLCSLTSIALSLVAGIAIRRKIEHILILEKELLEKEKLSSGSAVLLL